MAAVETEWATSPAVKELEHSSHRPAAANGPCIGAEQSRDVALSFLHADRTLLLGALDRINELLATNAKIIGRNLHLVFESGTSFARWLTGFHPWSRLTGFYYGDSGIIGVPFFPTE
jgi:hypothetical protein